MEHLRAMWKTAAGKRTLYRGISLEGASRQYAWGLDEAIVRKFSSAMKKGDHQTAAKVVLDLCEQSGEFVEGGHFGVWWSTDPKVARGYAGMHTRTSLACVVHAEVDDEDVNQGHAEEYGYTSEAPVVLREGARIDIVAIEVRYNPDLKVLRDGDFVKIPVRRQVTALEKMATIIPATTSAHGPFRTVVDVEQGDRGIYVERLECGHTGKTGWKAEWLGTTVDGKPSKRRCYDCLSSDHKSWLNERPGSQGHECSDACILPVRKTASMKDRAYRGVPLKLDAGQGVPILQALVKGQRNVAARLIIDAMAMRAMDKQRWWSVGDHPGDEAGRWWTSSKSAAYDYASGSYSENWMTMPVVMTAEFSEANDSAREDGQGAWWWHLPAGHPLTIVKFEAAIPDDPQALLDGWNGISSPGNFDHPVGVDGDFVDLPIPPMRTTAAVDYRKLVDALPSSYDQAIASAMENAYDMGLREEADDDGAAFWYQVYGEVMA